MEQILREACGRYRCGHNVDHTEARAKPQRPRQPIAAYEGTEHDRNRSGERKYRVAGGPDLGMTHEQNRHRKQPVTSVRGLGRKPRSQIDSPQERRCRLAEPVAPKRMRLAPGPNASVLKES